MAYADAQTAYRYEHEYWSLVEATMIELFQVDAGEARDRLAILTGALASAPADERLRGFHTEPLYTAAFALHRHVDLAETTRYLEIARSRGWGSSDAAPRDDSKLAG